MAVIISAREIRSVKRMGVNRLSSISQANTEQKVGEFWDAHDFTDFDDPTVPDVKFEIACAVPIELELFSALEKQARQHGVQVETLVNLWLQQRLSEQKS
ncbi:MAG: BrnA antitoxin family protein [Anaerolineae bacterium]|nr:BrnA antitoxin family protein [Anaerolineae bacterium]